MLVSLSPGVKEDIDSVAIFVVSEESEIDVETVVSLMVEEITIGDVALDGSVLAGTVNCDLCAELMIPISVTVEE